MEIRHGSTRTVILTSRFAIKLPTVRHSWERFLRGLVANLQERYWWACARQWPHVDPHCRLAPVVFSMPGGWLVVQRRAHVPRNFRRKFGGTIERLRPLFEGLPFDPNEQNFGFIGRRLVIIDYGS